MQWWQGLTLLILAFVISMILYSAITVTHNTNELENYKQGLPTGWLVLQGLRI